MQPVEILSPLDSVPHPVSTALSVLLAAASPGLVRVTQLGFTEGARPCWHPLVTPGADQGDFGQQSQVQHVVIVRLALQ